MHKKITTEKLQKILARAGLGSRRQMEEWIESGRVKLNNKIAKLGDRASETDRISVDKRVVHWKPEDHFRTRVLIYSKPEGVICTRSDPEGRPTIFDTLPKIAKGRWISIGRLDINSMGLLLFTNNGELAHRLMHPSFNIEREYASRVFGEVTPEMITILKKGVELEDGFARFESIKDAGGTGLNHWYHVILKEGRCRVVRRLWDSQGIVVSRLIRIRYGNIELPSNLKAGRWEELNENKVKLLESLVFPETKEKTEKKRTFRSNTRHKQGVKNGKSKNPRRR